MQQGAQQQDGEILMAAILIMLTDWDNVDSRQGRRGEYRTTGALQMPRLRTMPDSLKNSLMSTLNSIGLDVSDEDINETFSGTHEYQLSFSINRFESKRGEGASLTQREQRTLAAVTELIQQKPDAVAKAFPQLRKAG